jgi:hypothetical protein
LSEIVRLEQLVEGGIPQFVIDAGCALQNAKNLKKENELLIERYKRDFQITDW